MLVFEDETTTITQKPCVRKSMSFEGEQQKIEHNGSRKKEVFSAYISMLWPDTKLMYDFYEVMNSTNKHVNHLENLRKYVMKITWKRLILIWDNDASFHLSMTIRKYINTQKDWLTIIHLPKKAPYLNPISVLSINYKSPPSSSNFSCNGWKNGSG